MAKKKAKNKSGFERHRSKKVPTKKTSSKKRLCIYLDIFEIVIHYIIVVKFF